MIFKAVGRLRDKSEKAFFAEQIQVYRRLVEVFCEKNHLELRAKPQEDYVAELLDMGVIEDEDGVGELKAFLGTEYGPFEEAVNFVIANRSLVGDLVDKLSNAKRRLRQSAAQKEQSAAQRERGAAQRGESAAQSKQKLSLVDFFCGAGGLSLGFVQEGFSVKLANDIEDVCVQTYKYNHPELPADRLIQGDIKEILDDIGSYIEGDIDVVVGGPPCQGFSEANRQRVIDEPRNKLYKYFVGAVERIAPKVVVMENVKGMLKVAGQVVEDYERLRIHRDGRVYSYKVDYQILNSWDFGVAQSRERLIYIGVRDDVVRKSKMAPADIFARIREECQGGSRYVLMDALRDIKPLEAPRIKNQNEIDSDVSGKKIDVNFYEDSHNEYLSKINQGRKIPYVFNHKARYCSDVNYEIYRRLEQGDDATDEKVKDIMPYAHRNHCFKDKYYKLYADRPCRTITAHLKMDCHSHIHPYQVRALTPREAARVQSFPDDYLFWGAYLKTYMQIGNAVPVMMARGIARVVRECLRED